MLGFDELVAQKELLNILEKEVFRVETVKKVTEGRPHIVDRIKTDKFLLS